jgi:hypothetical protein
MKEKKRYKIIINWSGQVHTFYKWAVESGLALYLACIDLAGKLGYRDGSVTYNALISGAIRNGHSWEVIEL